MGGGVLRLNPAIDGFMQVLLEALTLLTHYSDG